jgi:type 1 glutamine amidotransferase
MMKRLFYSFGLFLWFLPLGCPVFLAADNEAGFKSLFNGKDLSGWDGDPKFWSVKKGVITGQTTPENPLKQNTFLIWKGGTVDDFELRLSYRIVGGNSGVQYRSEDLGNWVVGGYQADLEAGKTYTGILYEERRRGILAQRGQKTVIDPNGKVNVVGSVGNSDEIQASIKNEDWNDYLVIAKGNHLIHMINGRVTVDVTDEQAEKRSMSGILALQLHAGEPMRIEFKNIFIKSLREQAAKTKKIVLVAGKPSHGPGDHEFNAGTLLLKKCLDRVPGVQATIYRDGWSAEPGALDGADTILFFMDGGDNHPIIQGDHLKIIGDLMKKGVGLACVHYAVEVPKDKGGREFLGWIGGYYETKFSTNPIWDADFKSLPDHPITRGVMPFKVRDEWYFNIRFSPRMEGITSILVAKPSDETRQGTTSSPRGPYPHILADSGRDEVLAWAVERPDGGRGFGFTGAHHHRNWGNGDFRKLVLNALLWTAKMEVPAGGVESTVTEEELQTNLDPKPSK